VPLAELDPDAGGVHVEDFPCDRAGVGPAGERHGLVIDAVAIGADVIEGDEVGRRRICEPEDAGRYADFDGAVGAGGVVNFSATMEPAKIFEPPSTGNSRMSPLRAGVSRSLVRAAI
jgi:hypothetical protein